MAIFYGLTLLVATRKEAASGSFLVVFAASSPCTVAISPALFSRLPQVTKADHAPECSTSRDSAWTGSAWPAAGGTGDLPISRRARTVPSMRGDTESDASADLHAAIMGRH